MILFHNTLKYTFKVLLKKSKLILLNSNFITKVKHTNFRVLFWLA